MKLLTFILAFSLVSVYAQKPEMKYGFYVHIEGDTIPLGKKNWIDHHSHPQLLWVADSNGRSRVVLPDSVVFLRQFNYYYGRGRFVDYILMNIPTEKRWCRHYVTPVHKGTRADIYETPACYTCRSPRYYLVSGGKFVAVMEKKNFQELILRHFSDDVLLMKMASKKRYWTKFVNHLYKQQVPSKKKRSGL